MYTRHHNNEDFRNKKKISVMENSTVNSINSIEGFFKQQTPDEGSIC